MSVRKIVLALCCGGIFGGGNSRHRVRSAAGYNTGREAGYEGRGPRYQERRQEDRERYQEDGEEDWKRGEKRNEQGRGENEARLAKGRR